MKKTFTQLIVCLWIFHMACTSTIAMESNNETRRKLACDDSQLWHPKAMRGNEESDIFREEDQASKTLAKDVSIPVFKAALDNVLHQKSVYNGGELASLDPAVSNCVWLKVVHVERAGLGHTFACWAHYLHLAMQLGLTYYHPFFSADHDVCNLNETAHYFGLHSTYYWARSPPLNAVNVDVGKEKNDCDHDELFKAIQDYSKTKGPLSCEKGHVIFTCHNKDVDFQKRFVKSIEGVEVPVRAAFRSAHAVYGPQHQHPSVEAARKKGNLLVVAHIRRGDVLQSQRIDRDHRLVSFKNFVTCITSYMLGR